MKQDFIRDLKTAEFSYSASRVNELYEIWEWIKYYFLFDILMFFNIDFFIKITILHKLSHLSIDILLIILPFL